MRIRGTSIIVSSVVICLLMIPAAFAGGEASLLLGKKILSEDIADELHVDSQNQFGLLTSWDFEWPVALAVDILRSSDDSRYTNDYYGYLYEYDTDLSTTELNVGVRKFWGDQMRWYVGGGLALIEMDLKIVITEEFSEVRGIPSSFTLVDDSDSGVGYFANAGVQWRIGERFVVGLDVRHSAADVDLTPEFSKGESEELKAGGLHYGATFGARW